MSKKILCRAGIKKSPCAGNNARAQLGKKLT